MRLVSASQYGYISTKYLCGIELHVPAWVVRDLYWRVGKMAGKRVQHSQAPIGER